MASIATFGLSKIEVKKVSAVDTEYKTLGMTYQDSCSLTQNDPEVVEHYAEESESPVVSVARAGKIVLSFSVMDADVDTLVSLLGGSKSETGAWNAPDSAPVVEMSIRVTPKSGMVIEIPRASVVAKISGNFSRSGLFLVAVTATVLKTDGKAKVIATPLAAQN
ncbi:MAG: hypothetical protein PHD21_05940 [Flavobacteriales bacterium]|nr:hypothetical protein [Flavobacteriales bacterium]